MPRTNEPGRSVASRLLEVLFAFRPGRSRLTLTQLTALTGMPHATVRRLLMELVGAGALDRLSDGSFTVDVRLWQLGTLAPLSMPLRAVALPFMEDLVTALGQHALLAVLEGDQVVIVERRSAPGAVTVVSQVGGGLPLHSTGVGKVLLAHGGQELEDRVIERGLTRYTPRTCTDPAELRQMLSECRRSGVVTVREEMSIGADSVATRIMSATGDVVAALSIIVKAGSVDLRSVTPTLIASGLGASRGLGWSPHMGVRSAH